MEFGEPEPREVRDIAAFPCRLVKGSLHGQHGQDVYDQHGQDLHGQHGLQPSDVLQLPHVDSCLPWTRTAVDLFVIEESVEYHVVVHLRDVLGEAIVLLEKPQQLRTWPVHGHTSWGITSMELGGLNNRSVQGTI